MIARITCRECNGSGRITEAMWGSYTSETCPECRGSGRDSEAMQVAQDERTARIEREKERIDRAIEAGNSRWLIEDGIADDENLEGIKPALYAYVARRFPRSYA